MNLILQHRTYCSNTFVHQTLTYLLALASRRFFINITQGEIKTRQKQQGFSPPATPGSLTVTETKRRDDFLRCRKSNVDARPCDIDPDGGIGQVPTQGQQPALMTIDNNLSLFDFQPNSLLEKRGEWLPLDCQ